MVGSSEWALVDSHQKPHICRKACGARWDFNMSLGQNRLQRSNNPHCTIGGTVITLRSCWVSIMRKWFMRWIKVHMHKCSECHPFYVWGFPLCVCVCVCVSCQEFKDPSALPLRAVQPTLGLRTRYWATEYLQGWCHCWTADKGNPPSD